MQRFLTKLTPDEAAAQQQRLAAEVDARVEEERAAVALRPPPRGSYMLDSSQIELSDDD